MVYVNLPMDIDLRFWKVKGWGNLWDSKRVLSKSNHSDLWWGIVGEKWIIYWDQYNRDINEKRYEKCHENNGYLEYLLNMVNKIRVWGVVKWKSVSGVSLANDLVNHHYLQGS